MARMVLVVIVDDSFEVTKGNIDENSIRKGTRITAIDPKQL